MAIKDDMENVQETVINELITENGITNTLDDNQVTETKILNGAVTPAKLSQAYLPLTGGSVSGNVGIGTSSPTAILHIDGTNPNLVLGSSGNELTYLQRYNNDFYVFNKETSGNMLFGTANAERMRIDSDGNVVIKTSGGALRWNNGYQTITGASNANDLTYRTYQSHIFKNTTGAGSNTDGTERMRIDSSGNLIVGKSGGTSNASQGVLMSQTGEINAHKDSSHVLLIDRGTNDGTLVLLRRDGSTKGTISISGSTTSYNTSSDYRLKTDAQPMTGASARVQALNPVNFEWISDGTRVDGFIAHEAQEVVPEAVHGTKDALDEEGNPEYQGIDQSKLVPLLTKALQEALTKIESLEARVASLENT